MVLNSSNLNTSNYVLTTKNTLQTKINGLFNNMGSNHQSYQDFNNTPDFGFWFIQGSVNSPATNGATQYYCINQGLGKDYAWTGINSYGIQIGIPRNVYNPYISIRYKENNAFDAKGWQKISAGQADKLTTARTINGVSFDGTANITIPTSQWTTSGSTIYYNGGDVGIGTASPAHKLQVMGNIYQQNTGNTWQTTIIMKNDLGTKECNICYGSSANNIIGNGNFGIYMNGAFRFSILHDTGNVGIGTTNPTAKLTISGASAEPRIILSGTEFFYGNITSTDGIAFLTGVNRTNNRQLWIGDSAKLVKNTTDGVLRLIPLTGTCVIDSIATNGTTKLNLNLHGSITILADGKVGINKADPEYTLDISGDINFSGKLRKSGVEQVTFSKHLTFEGPLTSGSYWRALSTFFTGGSIINGVYNLSMCDNDTGQELNQYLIALLVVYNSQIVSITIHKQHVMSISWNTTSILITNNITTKSTTFRKYLSKVNDF